MTQRRARARPIVLQAAGRPGEQRAASSQQAAAADARASRSQWLGKLAASRSHSLARSERHSRPRKSQRSFKMRQHDDLEEEEQKDTILILNAARQPAS